MINDLSSSWGALGAIKGNLCGSHLKKCVEDAPGYAEAVRFLFETGQFEEVKASPDDLFGIERHLLFKYSCGISSLSCFFPDAYFPVLQWLQADFDLYNIRLLAKSFYHGTDLAGLNCLFFSPPVSHVNLPDNLVQGHLEDIKMLYASSFVFPVVKKTISYLKETDDFHLFEISCDIEYLMLLYSSVEKFTPMLKTSFIVFIERKMKKIRDRLERLGIDRDTGFKLHETLRKNIALLNKAYFGNSLYSQTPAKSGTEVMYSPFSYFMYFYSQRQLIREIVSELASKKARL